MSASENQAAEAVDTGARKIGPTGNKIRIRLPLPLRKRLAKGLQTTSTGVPENAKNHPANEVPEHTGDTTQNTRFIDAKVMIEEISTKPPTIKLSTDGNLKTMSKDRLCEQANSNSLCKTMSKDKLCEEASFIAPSLNLTVTAGMQDKTGSSYFVQKASFEDVNRNIVSNGLPPESSESPKNEACVEAIDNTPIQEPSITEVQGEVEKNNSITKPCEAAASKDILSNRMLNEANSNTSSKGVTVEAKINNSSKNLKTSAVKCGDLNDNSVGNNLFEEDRKSIASVKLSTKAIKCSPIRRPSDLSIDKKSSKKRCTSAVQATDTCLNTSGMKLPTPVGPAVEHSTSTAFMEAAKVYKEFEEKVKRTVYLDNLSLLATDAVITMALNQFGSVKNVSFLTNYTVPFDVPRSALVEMETEKDVESVVNILNEFPFMISGMPRPARAKRATAEMFNDRPRKPGRKLEFRWVDPTDPDYPNVRKFKLMSKRHELENLALIKYEIQAEALLAKHQQDNLNCHYRKFETVQSGWINRLAYIYNLSFDEWY